MVWFSHVFQNFPRFVVIHTVKGFGIVNKAEVKQKQFSTHRDSLDVHMLDGKGMKQMIPSYFLAL